MKNKNAVAAKARTSAEAGGPGKASAPGKADAPAKASAPVKGRTPAKAAVAKASVPEKPDLADKANVPDNADVPDKTSAPSNAGIRDKPNAPNRAGMPDKAGVADTTGVPDKADVADTASSSENAGERPVAPERTAAAAKRDALDKVSAPPKAGDASKAGPSWYRPVKFAELPGWERDDHLAAFNTFLKSCERVIARGRDAAPESDTKGPRLPPSALVAACIQAVKVAGEIATKEAARAFFEENFIPNAVVKKEQPGLLTGYYEPVLDGSRNPEGRYQTPIYKRPPDLVNVVDDTQRGTLKPGALTHVRKTATGTEPYYTRAEIDAGALKGQGLELLYLADSVDLFFMQIQGSGRVRLTDGTIIRVHYDGKNGHPYSSIGRYLVEKAILAADRISMGALAAWLRADPDRGKKVMWQNSSYVFFREIKDDIGAPLGAMRVPLTPVRSLAIDPSFHALGTPIYINVPTMKHVPNAAPFNRLMIGQDVGSAIKGAERGDIYFGSGDEAAKLAGGTKYPGRFFVLVPKGPPATTAAGPAPQKAQE
ncbi:MAG TPA: MltA domain-containing protein [Hyphomicrobiaceae bacterium]|nr:MltA domain-containing protein [Hyphomicrobiaceae bacterium]